MRSEPFRQPSLVALIPARCGSTRLVGKNIRELHGHPLIAYTIQAALDSRVFTDVVVATDSEVYADIARYYGAEVPFLRSRKNAGSRSPDIEWVDETLTRLRELGRDYDCFSILRPTSPFRLPATIARAWDEFLREQEVDSLRAVELCSQHPGKMWIVNDRRMTPLLAKDFFAKGFTQPMHSSQYQVLPEVYVQNASLEIAWSRVVFNGHSIAGDAVMPFITRGNEGLDVNTLEDWWYAENLLAQGDACLVPINQPAYGQKKAGHGV
ncbi:MAG: CMP-N,N'-diacetyllegionaminic acid synthase [Gammaproteobacteria bacterium]|nr:MAG: CMP-N,N'-diacetyllegionaminic acid synthase [Gammaproteobacteria bacterium]